MRSKDPATQVVPLSSIAIYWLPVQVGACIVNDDKRIVGIGYNGFPRYS